MAIAKPLQKARPAPAVAPRRLPMTYEQYLTWFDEGRCGEWVNGEVIVVMPPGILHQEVVAFLATLLRLFVDSRRLGKVLFEPFEMRATPGGNARLPDILFVAAEHLERLTPLRLAGPADLLVEVVSPESVTRDRKEKLLEYEAAGVHEYWVIDPRPQRFQANFWQLDERGRYQAAPVGADGIYRAAVLPGFWLDLAWLRSSELPDPLLTYAQIVGMPAHLLDELRRL